MNEINFQHLDKNTQCFEQLYVELLRNTKEVLSINVLLSFSVNFIDSLESIKLNKQYRNKEYIGDVISFPIDDDFGLYEQIGFKEIGDIFICLEEAQNKATKYEHTLEEEMAWLFVHGLLHILGYDHEESIEEESRMFKLTDEILAKSNLEYEIKY